MTMELCVRCQMPFTNNEPVEMMGGSWRHRPNRCVELLKKQASALIAAAEERAEKAEVDSKRLDWLEQNGWTVEEISPGKWTCYYDAQGITDRRPGPWQFYGATPREAIDAAIAAQGKAGK